MTVEEQFGQQVKKQGYMLYIPDKLPERIFPETPEDPFKPDLLEKRIRMVVFAKIKPEGGSDIYEHSPVYMLQQARRKKILLG